MTIFIVYSTKKEKRKQRYTHYYYYFFKLITLFLHMRPPYIRLDPGWAWNNPSNQSLNFVSEPHDGCDVFDICISNTQWRSRWLRPPRRQTKSRTTILFLWNSRTCFSHRLETDIENFQCRGLQDLHKKQKN